MKSFNCYYSMYLHHKGIKSKVIGENIIDAIKKRNQYAILSRIIDEDGTEYFVREHDEASPDKYFDYYWVDKDNNVLYDEKEDKWGYYFKKEKEIEEVEKKPSIIKDDIKVKVLAYDGKIIFAPNKPFENINNDWFPVNDSGLIGSYLGYTKKNLGVSKEALELMTDIKNGNDGIGDIDWYQMSNGSYSFSWIGWLYRVMDPKDSIGARGFYTHKDECVIIENNVTEEMISGINKYKDFWKLPQIVTQEGLIKYNRKIKLNELV